MKKSDLIKKIQKDNKLLAKRSLMLLKKSGFKNPPYARIRRRKKRLSN